MLLIVPKGITYTYNKVIELTSSDITEPGETPQTPLEPPEPTIGREQDIESDVSNRRFDLWKSGLEIYRLKPIFGVSIFNAVAFAQEQLPTTYLINNDAGIFDSLHNAFLNVLMGQGIVGFVIFMIFIVLCVVLILKGYLKPKKEEYWPEQTDQKCDPDRSSGRSWRVDDVCRRYRVSKLRCILFVLEYSGLPCILLFWRGAGRACLRSVSSFPFTT